VYTYQAGTSTPLATYTDQAGGTPNTNPIILDANGEAQIWVGPLPLKVDLFSALNVHQSLFPIDHILPESFYPVAAVTVPAVNGATVLSATAIIPAGARVLTVGTKVLIQPGASNGLTAFAVGDGEVCDRWGISAALTVNALTGTSDAPAAAQARLGELALYPTARTVVLTALGGTWDGTGSIQVAPQYLPTPFRSA